MENITETLCDFAMKFRFEDLDQETLDRTRMFIADYYGASFAGYSVNKIFNRAVLELIKEFGGIEQSHVLFEPQKYPVCAAAFINAVYAHGADMDDGNKKAAGHIGSHVMPAVFAMADKLSLTWKEIITAINVGYEFFNRIAGAAQPSLYRKGFHSTGIAGAVACAAACAKLTGLDFEGIYNSVSLAAIQSSGLIIIDESGQECKPINPANASKVGVLSALMAEKGVKSSKNPLESGKGWFHAFSNEINESILLEGLGKKFTICESYLKLYPTCRHTHSCIDAVLDIRNHIEGSDVFDSGRIKKIKVFTYSSAIRSAGQIKYPKTVGEAKFSIYYAIAVALEKGKFELADLEPDYANDGIRHLINQIELAVDDTLEDREKNIRGARVKVLLKNGEIFESTVLVPKGEGEKILSWEELQKKVISCAEGVVSTDRVLRLVDDCKTVSFEDNYIPFF